MRRIVIAGSCLVFLLSACGSDKKNATPRTTTTTASTTSTPVTASTSTTGPVVTAATTTTTTAVACPNTGSTIATSTVTGQPAALLAKVGVTTSGCRDSVTFTFEKSGTAVPSCKVEYKAGPFVQDGSGKPVAVAGSAFLTVRCQPAYGYDFVAGAPTYTGSKRITPSGTRHVRAVVETGDFEGVLNWVIGLDQRRGYGITAGGTPNRLLTITFS